MTVINNNSLSNRAALGMLGQAASLASSNGDQGIDLSVLALRNSKASALNATQLYESYDKKGAALLEKNNNSRAVKESIDYFTNRIKKVKTVDEIFKDRKLYEFITTAVGLGQTATEQPGLVKRALTGFVIPPDQVRGLQAKGLLTSSGRPVDKEAQKFLVEKGFLDPANPTRIGVANQLSDPSYANAAAILNFANTGVETVKLPSTINTLIRQYKSIKFEDTIYAQNPDVVEARYALAKLPGLVNDKNTVRLSGKDNVYKLLSDPTLRDFISTAFNIPKQIASQSTISQANIFATKVDMSRLDDPTYVNKLIKTYLTQVDSNTGTASASVGQSTLSLFGR